MTLKSKALDHLFFLIMSTVYTYALSKSIVTSTVLMIPDKTIFFLSITCILIFFVYFFNKYTFIFFSAAILFVAVFVYVNLAIQGFKVDWYVELNELIYEMYWFVRGYFPHREEYNLTLVIFTVTAIAAVTAANLKHRFGFYTLAIFGGCIIMIPVVMNYSRTEEASLIFSFCFLVLFAKKLNLSANVGSVSQMKKNPSRPKQSLKNFFRSLINRYKLSEASQNPGFSLALIPICTCFILLVGILPMPGVRIYVPNQVLSSNVGMEAVNDFFYVAFNPKYFSFQTSGFTGKDGRLGGRVTANGRFVMEVYSDERVYLSGAIRDSYTGWSWSNTKTAIAALKEYEDTAFDTNNGSSVLHNIVGNNRQVKINVGSSRTQTVFVPANTSNIVFDSAVTLYQNEAGDFSLSKLLGKNSGYTIDYKYLNSEDLSSAMSMSRFFGIFEEPGITDFSAYLALPEALPQRIYDLSGDITAKESDDFQKMKALEGYLRGFSYTLEPEDMPDGVDFVDYFLFEGKEGYCTYYASALAVMGRCIGIPTRYIEGFVMPPQKNSNGAYEVTSYQAHAWVEGYISGIGWVAFEPTAPFAYNLDTNQSSVPGGVFSDSMYENESDYYQYMMEMGFARHASDFNVKSAPLKIESKQEKFERTIEFVLTVTIAVLSFVLTMLAIFGLRVLMRHLKFKKIEKLSNKDAVIAYFAHILKVAKVYEYPIMKNETAFAYARRIGMRFAFENETVYMMDLARIFSEASYGNEDVSEENKRKMRGCYFEFLNRLRRYKLYKVQFIFYKYIISII